jgi:hypothetical protein
VKLRFEKDESGVQTIDPALVTALVALRPPADGSRRRCRPALAAENEVVAAVWHSRRARFVVQLTATERR